MLASKTAAHTITQVNWMAFHLENDGN